MVLVCFSCKKEPHYITIYPLPYLPVYPGSNWKYLDQNGDTVIQTTDPEYKLNSYKCKIYNSSMNEILETDLVYVPYWNGVPVYGYSSPNNDIRYGYAQQIAYLNEVQGQSWGISSDPHYGYVYRKVANNDTSLVVNSVNYSHVIRITQIVHSYNPYIPESWSADYYYAKDIGLIYQKTINGSLSLVSYYINR